MHFHRWNVFMVICLAAFSLAACSSPEPAVENEAAENADLPPVAPESTDPIPPFGGIEQSTSGQLQSVDVVARTLTIKDIQGTDQTFSFSDSTEIIGAAGVQGLTGQQGNQVLVRHADLEGRKMAVRVEIVQR